MARRYLSYFQGDLRDWDCADQELLRDVVPRGPAPGLRRAPASSSCWPTRGRSLELRPSSPRAWSRRWPGWRGAPSASWPTTRCTWPAPSTPTCADKAARFLQLCEAFGLPVVSLCDTPGFMVGPEAEETALVRHVSRMFVVGASAHRAVLHASILRKGYGLGAQAMAGGSFHRPLFTVAWPTGELGGMGLEGAVRLGFRRELDAIEDPDEREAAFAAMVARAYEHGKALNVADALRDRRRDRPGADPARIVHALEAAGDGDGSEPARAGRDGRRPFVDTW